jgi:uncharacterized protein (TIGR03437 family)
MTYASHKVRAGAASISKHSVTFALIVAGLASGCFGQTCSVSPAANVPAVHVEGLAELVSDINVSCTGGTGGTISTLVAVAANANITNRLDANGNVTGVTLTGAGVITLQPPNLNSDKVLLFPSVSLPGASPQFTISGLRVAVPTATGGGTTPFINVTVSANQLPISTQPVIAATSGPTLLSSVFNYGLPCTGSPAPTTTDMLGLIAAGTSSSTVRVTEATPAAFSRKTSGADFGTRFLVNLSGYPSTATIYVPDVIVGNRASSPTTSGALGQLASPGVYDPSQAPLLLARVVGADATGLGGAAVLTAPPGSTTSITTAFQVPLSNGAATVTYEVVDASAAFIDSAQIPVYVVLAATNCSGTPASNSLAPSLAPTSTVSIASQTDPIPRYVATVPGSDCTTLNDCSASYFPVLQFSPGSVTLSGASQGPAQTGFITLTNGGSNQFSFSASVAYVPATGLSSANWLSLNASSGVVGPTAGVSSFTLVLTASPSALLIPGTYQATVTINAGSAGTATVPVTFNVGPAGPIIQSVVNSANGQPGAVAAGSFVSIYGLNLVPKNPPATVTFNGFPATISYIGQPSANGPSQINVLVPPALGIATSAGVIVTVDTVVSNTFAIKLAPNAPAVFNPGILNQNNTVNLASAPASKGDIVQVFLTGLAPPIVSPLTLTVTLGNQPVDQSQIKYVGPVPSIPGLEQINVQVPPALTFTGNSTPLSVCVTGSDGQATCSAPVSLYLIQ